MGIGADLGATFSPWWRKWAQVAAEYSRPSLCRAL